MGARPHPNSGAGKIKWDASTDQALIEVKEASKSHTVTGALLEKLFRDAVRQNKTAHYVIKFGNGITLMGVLGRE